MSRPTVNDVLVQFAADHRGYAAGTKTHEELPSIQEIEDKIREIIKQEGK